MLPYLIKYCDVVLFSFGEIDPEVYRIADFYNIKVYKTAYMNRGWFVLNSNQIAGNIKKVAIKQQCDGIDIVIDFWTNDNLHYVLIVEDKTTSSAHTSQLEKYAKTMDGWNNNEEGYLNRRRKVFYKVSHLTDQDKKELEIGNKKYDESDKLRVFDINKIYSFFSNIKKQNLKY